MGGWVSSWRNVTLRVSGSLLQDLGADAVQDQVGATPPGEFPDLVGPVCGAVVDDGVGARRAGELAFGGRARGADDQAGAGRPGELDRDVAHPAGRRVDQHRLALAQSSGPQDAEGDQSGAREDRGLGGVQLLGHGYDGDGVDDDLLGVGAVEGERTDPVSRPQGRDARSHRGDPADHVAAEDDGEDGPPHRRGEGLAPHLGLRVADAHGVDGDSHLAGAGFGDGTLGDVQHVGVPVPVELHGTHHLVSSWGCSVRSRAASTARCRSSRSRTSSA